MYTSPFELIVQAHQPFILVIPVLFDLFIVGLVLLMFLRSNPKPKNYVHNPSLLDNPQALPKWLHTRYQAIPLTVCSVERRVMGRHFTKSNPEKFYSELTPIWPLLSKEKFSTGIRKLS
jgi:hypothetical protein